MKSTTNMVMYLENHSSRMTCLNQYVSIVTVSMVLALHQLLTWL